MVKRLNSQRKDDIQRLAGERLSHSEIARQIGCSRQSVARVLARSGVSERASRSKQINVRLSEEEESALRKMADAHDITPSEMLRSLVRMGAGAVDLRGGEAQILRESSNQMNALARNLVQILQLGRAGRLSWNARDSALVSRLTDRTEEVARALQGYRAVAARGVFVSAGVAEEDVANG